MPDIIAPSARQAQYNGTHGNGCIAALAATLSAAAAGTVIALGDFDSKPEITDFRLDHANLGASTSIDLGFEYFDGTPAEPDVIADGLATTASGSKRMAKAAVRPKNTHVKLIATVRGGVASGQIDLVVNYRNVG